MELQGYFLMSSTDLARNLKKKRLINQISIDFKLVCHIQFISLISAMIRFNNKLFF